MKCLECDKPVFKNNKCKFHNCFRETTTTTKESNMELLIPSSLITAMNKTSMIDVTIENFTSHIDLALKTISNYEAEHKYVPVEWNIFKSDLASVLSTLTVLSKEEFMKETQSISVEVARLKWTLALIQEGYTEAELTNMNQVELRDLYEEIFPSTLTSYTATATGGVSKRVTLLKKQA